VSASRRGIVLMVAAMGLFSLSDVMAKRLMSSLPALEIVWIRYFVLALTIVWMIARGEPLPRTARPAVQIGRGACLVVSTACYNFGLAFLPLAAATALVFSSPLFVILLSVIFLGEHYPARRWGWPLLGFAGVIVVANPDPATFNPAALFPFAASLLWGAAMVMTRRISTTESAFAIQAWSAGVAVVLLTVALPFVFVLPALALWPEIIAMGVLWAVAQWFVIHAYHASEASDIAPYAYSQLVWASLFGALLFAQIPDARTLTGAAMILLAGVGSALAGREPRVTR
jgi:drug/metabolite transporter (DMT)-like permease